MGQVSTCCWETVLGEAALEAHSGVPQTSVLPMGPCTLVLSTRDSEQSRACPPVGPVLLG